MISATLSMLVFSSRKRNQVGLSQVGWRCRLLLTRGKNMGQGSGEVSWVRLRNSEATAILRLSTIRLDQALYSFVFAKNTSVRWYFAGVLTKYSAHGGILGKDGWVRFDLLGGPGQWSLTSHPLVADATNIIASGESAGFNSRYTSLSYSLDRSSLIIYMATTITNRKLQFLSSKARYLS